jgi:hypothetical protein
MRASLRRPEAKVRGAGEGCPPRPLGVHQGPRPRCYPFSYADTWVPLIVKKARRGLKLTFKCIGWFKSMASKSYWSYGLIEFIGAVPSTLSPPDFDKEICRLSLEALSYIPRLLVSYFIGIDE